MQENLTATSRGYMSRLPIWSEALDECLDRTSSGWGRAADLVLVFASFHHAAHYEALLGAVKERTSALAVTGCSGQGIIGTTQEIEGQPALSLLQVWLPGARLYAAHITQDDVASLADGSALIDSLGVHPSDVNAWLVFADPFRLDVERAIDLFEQTYPHRPIAGGLASGAPGRNQTHVFLNGDVFDEGAIAVGIGGEWTVRTLVSQGATPIGSPWTITGAHDNLIESIGGRPAYEVLTETIEGLEPQVQQRAVRNLLVGLAMNEYRDDHQRGDFLIRNLLGVERETGALAISAYPRIGQTIQFQMRDAQAADDELVEMLRDTKDGLIGGAPIAAVLCSCNGRGVGLFGQPNHDAQRIAESLGPVPLAGFFCNGEIGPVGGRTFLHGFTASLAMFVPKDPASPSSDD
jgi:small ligand-binding sensory domain FIST